MFRRCVSLVSVSDLYCHGALALISLRLSQFVAPYSVFCATNIL